MILQHSVFQDTFIANLLRVDLSSDTQYENPLLYYIMHRSEPFPTGSKYSQYLSNLFQKNYSGKSQPPQIRMLLSAIDFKKLSNRIQTLSSLSPVTVTEPLQNYLQSVTVLEPQLLSLFTEYHMDALSDRFSLVLLYALFDETSLQNYLSDMGDSAEPKPMMPPSANYYTDSDPSLPKKYRRLHTQYLVSIITLIGLTVLQMLGLIMPFIIQRAWENTAYNNTFLAYLILMLIISIALFSLRRIPYSLAKQAAGCRLALMPDNDILLDDSIPHYHRFHNNSHHFTTMKFKKRLGMYLEGIFWLLSAIAALLLNSFPLFIAGAAITLIIYLECDHLLNRQYAILYDEHYPSAQAHPAHKGKVASGEAKIYSWDYDPVSNDFRHHRIKELPDCSADSIRHIFYSRIDRYQYQWTIAGVILTTLNVFTIIIGVLQFLFPLSVFIRIENQIWFLFFCLILLISTEIYYIILLLRTEERFNMEAKLSYYCSDAPLSDHFIKNVFRSLYVQGTLKNVDIGHGLYHYNCYMYENGLQVTDLPEDDRMIVIHRYYDAVRRVSLDFLFFAIAYFCIFVWHLGWIPALWGLPVIAVIYIVFAFWLFPQWDAALMRHKIRKYVLKQHP